MLGEATELASAGAITSANSTGVSSGATRDRGERTVSARRLEARVSTALAFRVRSGLAVAGMAIVVVAMLVAFQSAAVIRPPVRRR